MCRYLNPGYMTGSQAEQPAALGPLYLEHTWILRCTVTMPVTRSQRTRFCSSFSTFPAHAGVRTWTGSRMLGTFPSQAMSVHRVDLVLCKSYTGKLHDSTLDDRFTHPRTPCEKLVRLIIVCAIPMLKQTTRMSLFHGA